MGFVLPHQTKVNICSRNGDVKTSYVSKAGDKIFFKTEFESQFEEPNILKPPIMVIDRPDSDIDTGEPDFEDPTPQISTSEDNNNNNGHFDHLNDINQKEQNNQMTTNDIPNNKINGTSKSRPSTYRNHNEKFKRSGEKVDSFDLEEGINYSDTTPIYLMNGHFFSFSEADSFANEEFANVLRNIQWTLQPGARFDVDKSISSLKLTKFITLLVESLELYFCVTSIVDYATTHTRGNGGLFYLRRRIHAEDIYDLAFLKSIIETIHFNPNLVSFIKYMYGNFSTNSSKLSPVIKLVPGNLFLDDININEGKDKLAFISGKTLRDKANELRDQYYIATQFKFLFPKNKIDLSNFDSSIKYDANFLSFWHNTSCVYYKGKEDTEFTSTRHVEGLKSNIYLGVFSDSIKGESMASTAIHESKSKIFETGIYVPCKNYPSNLDFANRVSLHIYNRNFGIIGIRSYEDAAQSFLYATPYTSTDGSHSILTCKFQSKELNEPSLYSLRKYAHQLTRYVFLS